MFKQVHYLAKTVGKRLIGIQLKCLRVLLVSSCPNVWVIILYSSFTVYYHIPYYYRWSLLPFCIWYLLCCIFQWCNQWWVIRRLCPVCPRWPWSYRYWYWSRASYVGQLVYLEKKKQINFIFMYVNNGMHLFQTVFARILLIENDRFKPYLHLPSKSSYLSAIPLIFLM